MATTAHRRHTLHYATIPTVELEYDHLIQQFMPQRLILGTRGDVPRSHHRRRRRLLQPSPLDNRLMSLLYKLPKQSKEAFALIRLQEIKHVHRFLHIVLDRSMSWLIVQQGLQPSFPPISAPSSALHVRFCVPVVSWDATIFDDCAVLLLVVGEGSDALSAAVTCTLLGQLRRSPYSITFFTTPREKN